MSDEYLKMCNDFTNIISNEKIIKADSILEILKKYSSTVSVFDMMDFTSQVMKENKYVQASYRKESQKSYIESFLLRVKDITKDTNNYTKNIDRKSFIEAVDILEKHYENEAKNSKTKGPLIFDMASIYATFVLEEPIHPVGTPFPGSLKVEKKDDEFYCPVKEANLESPNAVCKMCLAEQLDF